MFYLFVLFVSGMNLDITCSLPLLIGENVPESSSEVIANFSRFSNLIFGAPSESAGRKVSDWNFENGNIDEVGPYFEGDILIPREQGRNGLADLTMRWSNATIPYVISREFSKLNRKNIFFVNNFSRNFRHLGQLRHKTGLLRVREENLHSLCAKTKKTSRRLHIYPEHANRMLEQCGKDWRASRS